MPSNAAVETRPVRVESSDTYKRSKALLVQWMDETGGYVLEANQRDLSESPVWHSTRRPADIPPELDPIAADRAIRREQLRERRLRARTRAEPLTPADWNS
jgi:hypothetical protein